jgi:hypothetical protein
MSVEIAVKRRNTNAFIGANRLSVVLIPRVPVQTGSGTRWADQTPRSPQVVRLIDQSSAGGPNPGTVAGADGKQRKVEFQMIGNWDAVFGLYDYWMDAGTRLEVAELLPYNGYERRAQVVRYGQG